MNGRQIFHTNPILLHKASSQPTSKYRTEDKHGVMHAIVMYFSTWIYLQYGMVQQPGDGPQHINSEYDNTS